MMRLGRFSGTSLAHMETMFWDRALAWWPEAMIMLEELKRR